MNYQELLEDNGLLPQAGFCVCSRAVCFYRQGDEKAEMLCRQMEKKWNQFTWYQQVPEEELGEMIMDIMDHMEQELPYGGIGFQHRLYILYITSSFEDLDVQRCVKEYPGMLRIDIARVTERRNMSITEVPNARGARFQWFLDHRRYSSHYALMLLLLCEIYNDKGAYLFLASISQRAVIRNAFSIIVSVYNVQAQKKARTARDDLGHALGFSLRGREAIDMVAGVFFERFQYTEKAVRQIYTLCPRICDLIISWEGYEKLLQQMKDMGPEKRVSYFDMDTCLYGAGDERLGGPKELLAEVETVIEKACYEWLKRNCQDQMYNFPYRFFIQEASGIIKRERAKEDQEYQKQLACFQRMFQEEWVSGFGSSASLIWEALDRIGIEFDRCVKVEIRVKWWDVLDRFIQDSLIKDQRTHMELQECYYFLEDYIIEDKEEEENLLTREDLRSIDWKRSTRSYFETDRSTQTEECEVEDLYWFRERMNWRLQGRRGKEDERRSFYLYGADKSLEERFRSRYGKRGDISDVIFLEGAGKRQLYLLHILAWEESSNHSKVL